MTDYPDLSDEDWEFTEPMTDMSQYRGSGNDLSVSTALGEKLNSLRCTAAMDTADLAEASGISEDEIMALEAGLMVLQPAQAHSLAVILRVEPGELWTCDA